jgi:ribonuclease HI
VEYLDERDINIYTDGSVLPAPRRGGLGIVFVTEGPDGDWRVEPFEVLGYRGATSNQMERRACIEALQALRRGSAPIAVEGYRKVVIRTDSMLLAEGYRNARQTWPGNGWRTRDGNPVVDQREWKELVKAAERVGVPVEIEWVKGHKDSPYNKQADKLARASAKGHLREFPARRKVRRKKSPHQVQRGSVEMEGQRLTIRIIEESAPSGGLVRCKYEVMSTKSPFYQRVDYIWADAGCVMRAHHTYRVRVNSNTSAPRVAKIFGEVVDGPT